MQASADELKAMGLFSAARMIDSSLDEARPQKKEDRPEDAIISKPDPATDDPSSLNANAPTTLQGTGARRRQKQRSWVGKFVFCLFLIAIGIAVFLHMQKPLATWSVLAKPRILGEVLGAAIGLFVVSGLLPMAAWAFGRFRAEKAAGPLFAWFVLLLGAGFLSSMGQSVDAEKTYEEIRSRALSGKQRGDFVNAARSGCIETQNRDPLNQQAGLTAAQISAYCDCYANGLADGMTGDELVYFVKNRKPSPTTQSKIEALQPICIRTALGE